MPSSKPRIATYTDEITVKKFKIIAAYKGKSMSEYLEILIQNTVDNFEKENGEIKIDA